MPSLEILIYGHPFLRKKVSDIKIFDAKVAELARNMMETVVAHEGVGLAAPQVGIDARLIVIDPGRLEDEISSRPMAFINPFVLSCSGYNVFREGCLSIPGIYEDVKRPEVITMQFQDLNGQTFQSRYSGVEARILLHEIDHLNGILFIDHLNPIRRWLLRKKLNRLKEQSRQSNALKE